MKSYVIGLCFSPGGEVVALIRKNRPTWMRGKRNGVGGEVEPGESPLDAMVREWNEEVYAAFQPGVETPLAWEPMCTFGTEGKWRCHVFRAFSPVVHYLRGRTDEAVEIVSVSSLGASGLVEQADWFIPLCAQRWVPSGQSIHVEVAEEPRFVSEDPIVGVVPPLSESMGLALFDCGCGKGFVVPFREEDLRRETDAALDRACSGQVGEGSEPFVVCPCGRSQLLTGCIAMLSDVEAARGYARQGRITLGVGRVEGL